jgi:aminocarboxymuconate-semialdehyde decarboxylase
MSKGPSGIGFVGCDLLHAPATDGGAHDHAHDHADRREVVVNGTRIRTIDIHAHCAVPAANAVLGQKVGRDDLLMSDAETRLAAMDAQGLDMAALSINPYWYGAERDQAAEIIRLQNEALTEICAATPDRFVAFATIALQHPDLAVEQIRYAVKELGLRGVSIGCSVEGEELADEKYHPVWAVCEELNQLVFMHPQGTRELQASGRLEGSGALGNTIGNPLETTIALSHLIFEGTLDRFPGLKICSVHGGGYLASYAHRSDAVRHTGSHNAGPLPRKNPTAYLRDGQLYFDSLVFTPEALRHLVAETGPDKIMIGTDYPFGWTSTEVDLVMNTPELTDDDRIAILGGTAAKLLGLDG